MSIGLKQRVVSSIHDSTNLYCPAMEPFHNGGSCRNIGWPSGFLQKFLEPRGTPELLRVLSVGAGLGTVEEWLWDHHYSVDVLECQMHSLSNLKKRFPQTRGFLGDAREIPCRPGIYDLVYMSGVDYCFDRNQYRQVLAEMGWTAKEDGIVVSVCMSNLSLKDMALGPIQTAVRTALQVSENQGEGVQ